jgi:hypothetical protein
VVQKTFQARVVKGRLLLDAPSRLPEGTVVRLRVAESEGDGDELDKKERAALHAALKRSWKSAKAGRLVPADRVLRRLRAK